MNFIAFLDSIAFLSFFIASIVVVKGWRRRFSRDTKMILFGLIILNMLYNFSLILEWYGISHSFEPYEDLIGALVPMMWAFSFYALLQDTTARDLKESENRFRKLFEQSNDVIVIHEISRIIDVNQKASETLGYSRKEFLEMPINKLLREEDQHMLQDMINEIRKKKSLVFETQLVKKDGTLIDVEASSRIVEEDRVIIQGMVRDITERKKAEEEKAKLEQQLILSQKLEAIGTLAGGIAHDFNNILAAIIGYTDLALLDLEDPIKSKEALTQVQQGATRARELIQQILTLSRKSEQKSQPLDISIIVKEALKLLRSSLPVSIEIKQNIASHGKVLADAAQIHQIVMNLCTNAYHAMREKGGILSVSLKETTVSGNDFIPKLDLLPGNYIVLKVEDTGHGMSNEIKQRIFDPYFTTKKAGEGTGLGLAVVHGIVKNYKGHIDVYSEPGIGTKVMIYLPTIQSSLIGTAPTSSDANTQIKGGNENILFVDDELSITNFAQKILEKYGYQVTTCLDGDQAFQEFQKQMNSYDLVITDMTMPHMNGIELAQNIMELKPGFPIILCSGYSDLIHKETIDKMGIHFLEKPVEMHTLARAVRKILDKNE